MTDCRNSVFDEYKKKRHSSSMQSPDVTSDNGSAELTIAHNFNCFILHQNFTHKACLISILQKSVVWKQQQYYKTFISILYAINKRKLKLKLLIFLTQTLKNATRNATRK